jgi:hypothetical protein
MPPGDPNALEAAAARLTEAAARWGDLAGTTSRQAESVRTAAEWTGAAADQQEAYHAALSTGIARGEAPLTQVAGAIRSYAGYLRAAQQRVAAANSATAQAQATGSPAHATLASYTQADAQTALAQLDSEGNRAAATVAAADEESKGLFSPEGPLRTVIEEVHTALGFTGADGVLWALGKGPEAAEAFMKDLTGAKSTEADWLEEMLREAQANGESWTSVLGRWEAKSNAAEAFGKQFVSDTELMGKVTRGLRMVGAPIAIAGDVSTFLNPAQSGVMGDVDRAAAGVNAVYVGADGLGALGGTLGVEALADLSLGPVGAGIAVGTGLYLAGSYAYAHWTGFRDVCNDVGHGVVHAADAVGGGLTHAGADVGHVASSVWHDVF